MKTIEEHIKTGQFENTYLFYGEEAYIKKASVEKLKSAIMQNTDDMNYSYFEGKSVWLDEVMGIADTLPFFADKRLIIIEKSDLFSTQNVFSDFLKTMPDSTIIIFIEETVDKRSRLYKSINSSGYVYEINALKPAELKEYIINEVKKSNKVISNADAEALVELLGTDMMTVSNELEKLISYCAESDRITREDCEAICTATVSSHIFKMIDLIAERKQREVLLLYDELLKLRQSPPVILYNIIKHFNNLFVITSMRNDNRSEQEIIEKSGILPWKMRDYNYQLRSLGIKRLRSAVQYGLDIEERIKTGRIDGQIAVELMIIRLSS